MSTKIEYFKNNFYQENDNLFILNKDGTIKKDNNLNIQKINYDNISS